MSESVRRQVVLGRIAGVYGVRGWVKVISHTAPPANLLDYPRWMLRQGEETQPFSLEEGRPHGKGLVAKLQGCNDRDQAALLVGREIAVDRDELPAAGPDEYYWTDLEGLRVVNREGIDLGRVDHLFATGANDVMVVQGERERMLPFIAAVVLGVDLSQGLVTVDWDADF